MRLWILKYQEFNVFGTFYCRVVTVRESQGEKGFFLTFQGMSGNSVKSQGRIPKSQGNFLNSSNYSYTVRIQGSHIA